MTNIFGLSGIAMGVSTVNVGRQTQSRECEKPPTKKTRRIGAPNISIIA